MKRQSGKLAIVALGAAGIAVPLLAQAPALAMLDRLDRGSWELRVRGEGETSRICIDDGRKFIQLRHSGERCRRVVVEDSPSQVTVQYTCPGKGYGRTQIRRETDSLVQIDSQGIAGGLPFAFAAEARRVGNCGG